MATALLSEKKEKDSQATLQRILLAAVLLGALAVRLWGVNFGLPDIYHWDEYTDFSNAILALNDGGRMGNFVGASLPYLLIGIYWIIYLFLRLTGQVNDFATFEVSLFNDPTPAFLGGRLAAVMISVATVWLTYKTAILLYGDERSLSAKRRVGLIAATLLAFTSLHVQDSHYARGHVFAAFFILAALYFAYRIVIQPRTRFYLLTGSAVALATGAEFYAPAAMVLLVAGHFLGIWKRDPIARAKNLVTHRPFLLGSIGALFVFLAVTPAALFDTSYFLGWMRWYVQDNSGAWVDPEGLPVGVFYLVEHLRFGMGEPLLVLSLAGTGFLLWRRRKADLLLLSFLAVFFLILHRGPNHARFALPVLPFLAIASAALLDTVYSHLNLRLNLRRTLLALTVIIVLLPSFVDITRFDYYLGLPDTRSSARIWIEQNIPENATIVVEGGHGSGTHGVAGPQLQKNVTLLQKMLMDSQSDAERRFIKNMAAARVRGKAYEVYDVLRLEQISSLSDFKGMQYIVTSTWALTKSDRDPAYAAMLAKDYSLVASFEPNPVFKFDPFTWRMDYSALRSLVPMGGGYIAGPKLNIFERKALD